MSSKAKGLIATMRAHKTNASKESLEEKRQLKETLMAQGNDAASGDELLGLRTHEALLALSKVRENAWCWYSIPRDARVLELRCGTGAITGLICRQAGSVVAVATDPGDAEICNLRHGKNAGCSIRCGDILSELNQMQGYFDVIILHEVCPEDQGLLERAHGLLDPKGTLLLSASRRYDLAQQELEGMVLNSGYATVCTRYPYPNHHFARYIFSKERPPETAEVLQFANAMPSDFLQHIRNQDAHDDSLVDIEQFSQAAPSYMLEAHRASDVKCSPLAYAKISSERDKSFCLITTIERGNAVKKWALYPEGVAHIRNIYAAKQGLEDLFGQDGLFRVNDATLDGDVLTLEYLTGQTLQDRIVTLLEASKTEQAYQLFAAYRDRLMCKATTSFSSSEAFDKVFGLKLEDGDLRHLLGMPCLPITDIDLIPQNIMPDGDTWNLIDYEWTFDFAIPTRFVFWRTLQYLFLQNESLRQLEKNPELWQLFDLTDEDRRIFLLMEDSFQAYVTRGVIPVDAVLAQIDEQERAKRGKALPQRAKRLLKRLLGLR